MKTIYLTGFMGSGKTTIGRKLSDYLHIPVIDTDEVIIAEKGLSINSIFNQYGEQYFRDLEKNTLKSLPTKDLIVTTGGGIVVDPDNRKWMKNNGMIVYLHCDFGDLWDRLRQDNTRPLIANQDQSQIKAIYKSRQFAYLEHDLMIDTSLCSLDEITVKIGEWVKKEEK